MQTRRHDMVAGVRIDVRTTWKVRQVLDGHERIGIIGRAMTVVSGNSKGVEACSDRVEDMKNNTTDKRWSISCG